MVIDMDMVEAFWADTDRKNKAARADGEVESDWKPPTEFPSLSAYDIIAIDTETNDPDLKVLGPGVRRGAYMVGFSIAAGQKSWYFPIKHEGGDNLDPDQVLRWARSELNSYTGLVVGANLLYDLDYLAEEAITFPNATGFRDVQIAEPLLDEYRHSYSLDNIAKKHIAAEKDESKLIQAAKIYGVDPKGGLWKLPARFVGPYAEQDAVLPLRTIAVQERLILNDNLARIYELESELIPLMLAMRRLGVRIDEDRLQHSENYFLGAEKAAYNRIKDEIGMSLEGAIWSADACAKALQIVGVTCGFTETGKPQVDAPFLEKLDSSVAKGILRARKMNKVRTTFVEGLKKHMTNGRVHAIFNQLKSEAGGTVNGRLSCMNPNLLNQPTRDEEIGPLIRNCFIPEEGTEWAKCDYSQQEPRLTVHFAALAKQPGAQEAVDNYKDNPDMDYHDMMAELTKLPRKTAKGIFLGCCYGMGGGTLCKDHLGLPTETRKRANGTTYLVAGPEGKIILDQFHSAVPFINGLNKHKTLGVKAAATARGYITTLGGRRCRFPMSREGERMYVHNALNKLIQSSAADQTKRAMLDVWKQIGLVPHLQVYDELDYSVTDKLQALDAAKIMEQAEELLVPSKVDVEIGPSWGEVK